MAMSPRFRPVTSRNFRGDPGGPPRRVRPGLPADLVVLRAPLAQAARLPDPVRAVLIGETIAVEKE